MANLIKEKQIAGLSASKITAGILPVSRGGTGLNSIDTLLNANTTKADVGLANVPNTDATNASNINSGTLASSRGGLGVDGSSVPATNVFAGPVSGSNAAASFRVLAATDIPSLAASKITSGSFANDRISVGSVTQHNASIVTAATIKTALNGAIGSNALTVGNGDTVVTIPGDLIVQGSEVRLETTTLELDDHNIEFDKNNTNNAFTNGAGFTIVKNGDDLKFTCDTNGVMSLKIGDNLSGLNVGSFNAENYNLQASDIPNLQAAKITGGEFATDRIPNLAAAKITSGTFATDRIPQLDAAKIGSGNFGAARIASNAILADKVKAEEEFSNGIASPASNDRTFSFANKATAINGTSASTLVFLNGVLLTRASAQNKIGTGGSNDGDYFFDHSGDHETLEIDHELLTDSSDKITVKYISNV